MIKEPKTILSFVSTYFDLVRDLFEIQSKEGFIHKETLTNILTKYQSDFKQKLLDYKIIRSKGEDYELRDVYFKLFEFVLLEFRPLLPEEIDKYGVAISKLFIEIKEGISGNKNILIDRINALAQQVKEFWEAVEKNTIRLLNETRELKANFEKIEYKDKVMKASYWIEFYIKPLNTILDIQHSESIANKLLDVSTFAHEKKLNFTEETIRLQFEKLYLQLVQTNDDVLRQSKILTNELLPLIERIRTENSILTGWIEFLKNPYKVSTPKLLKVVGKGNPYTDKIYLNTKEYFENFLSVQDVFVEEDSEEVKKWLFNKAHYKSKLKEKLPMNNFFDWCADTLSHEESEISNEKFFALTSLIFEEDLVIDFGKKDEMIELKTESSKFYVPKIKVTENGLSETA